VTVLRPDGLGGAGLDVRVDGERAAACGAGCYSVPHGATGSAVTVALGPERVRFAIPHATVDGTVLVRRSSAAFRRQRSVVYTESLSSGVGKGIRTLWRLEAPDRVRYDIAGGASGVVIGGRRWDRGAGGPWRESPATPLDVPVPVWISAARVRDARIVDRSARTLRVAFLDPALPAWFDVALDRRTLLPRTLRMTAAAHFMHHRYLGYGLRLDITPPARP
jgi:hypothetical protein